MREMICRTDGAMRVEATDGTVTTWMDEPPHQGGDGTAPTPMQALLAALGGCTAITLKMYSARKGWPLEDVDVRVTMVDGARGEPNRWQQHVTLKGDLDEEQRERLMQIAGRCPVHRALEGGNVFEEIEAEPAGAE